MPRPQFTLRALLVAMLVVSVALGWFTQRRRRLAEEAATSQVLSKGGMVGSNSSGTVTAIVFAGQRGDSDLAANIADADLDVLRVFPRLHELDLSGRPITDAAVPLLSRLKTLRVLRLSGTKLTDDGVRRLQAAIPGCSIER